MSRATFAILSLHTYINTRRALKRVCNRRFVGCLQVLNAYNSQTLGQNIMLWHPNHSSSQKEKRVSPSTSPEIYTSYTYIYEVYNNPYILYMRPPWPFTFLFGGSRFLHHLLRLGGGCFLHHFLRRGGGCFLHHLTRCGGGSFLHLRRCSRFFHLHVLLCGSSFFHLLLGGGAFTKNERNKKKNRSKHQLKLHHASCNMTVCQRVSLPHPPSLFTCTACTYIRAQRQRDHRE